MELLFGFGLFCFYLYFLLKNFNKGVILIAFTIQFLPYLGTGIPRVKIFTLLSILVGFMWLLKNLFKTKNSTQRYPLVFLIVSLFTAFCYLTTTFVTHNSYLTTVLINLYTYFAFPVFVWYALSTRKNVEYGIRVIISFAFIFAVYALIEFILRDNPIFDFIENNFALEEFADARSDLRYGMHRCNSIFSYTSPFGFASCALFYIFFYLKFKYRCMIMPKKVNILLLILPFCILFTGSRAIYIGLIPIMLSFVLSSGFLKLKYTRFILCVLIVSLPFTYVIFSEILDSLLDTSKVGGSSTDMRQEQLEICLSYFDQSPIWGNGRMYMWDTVKYYHWELLGAESIWFPLLVDYGIMGAISFILLIASCSYLLYKKFRPLAFFPLIYFVITFVSPERGYEFNVLLTYTILLIKMHLLYNNTSDSMQSITLK